MWKNHKTERYGLKKKEFKVLPVHAMKAHKGSGGIAPEGGGNNTIK